MIHFILNEKTISTDLPSGMVMLDFIRYNQHLTGTKIGCREGDCGACTVLVGELINDKVEYRSMTSCLMPIGNARGKHIVTVEGINIPSNSSISVLNPVQQAMAEEGATQCGFCTPGFVMSLAGFCLDSKEPTNERAIAAIDGNICRCTGYKSIERAAGRIADLIKQRTGDAVHFATENNILPSWFNDIGSRLAMMNENSTSSNGKSSEQVVGGGTDLYVQRHEDMAHLSPGLLFDHSELKGIIKDGNTIKMGGAVTVSDLMLSTVFNEAFPAFHRYAKLISSTPIRNMATIAGNFINASPIGDLTIFFLALDTKVVLQEKEKMRTVALRKLYKGYKTLDKKPREFVREIIFTVPSNNTHFHFEKVSKRTHLDIASVNSAALLTVENKSIMSAAISAGGVGPVPLFLAKTSAYLANKEISEDIVNGALEIMATEIAPISDARGTKEYKHFLLGQLIRAHFLELFPFIQPQKLLA